MCRDGMTTPTASATDKTVPYRASARRRSQNPRLRDRPLTKFHPYTSDDQHGNWLDCIHSRKAPTAPVEIGHRACSTCLLHWIAMKTNHHVHWDPATESIVGDDIAGSLLSRHQRHSYELV